MNQPDFNLLFGFIPSPLIVFDAQTLKLRWTNLCFLEVLRLEASKIIGSSLEDLFDFRSCENLKRQFQAPDRSSVFTERHENLLLQQNLAPTGLIFSYRLSHYSEGYRRYILMWLNEAPVANSDRAKQKEIIHMSRLADVGRLSAGIAHELNNPLAIMQGYAENIAYMIADESTTPENMTMSIRQILKSISRMAKIISGIQRFVRNDDFNMARVDLNEIIPDASALFRSRMKSINAEFEFVPEVPRIVKCDPAQIEQIIINIMNNAFHALQEVPGERKVKVSFSETDDTVTMSIWNNGPEVPVEIREKIMSPFFTTKQVGEGTGLGLSVSYGIMKSHNGDLRFESSKGQGTCFYLDFPKPQADFADVGEQGKVVVVDSETSSSWVFANKLRLYGFNVMVAERGEEAEKLIRSHPDLLGLFIDLRMPDMDAFELTRKIRRSAGYRHQIYLLSPDPLSFKEELSYKRAGVDDIVEKPVPIDRLSAAARSLLSHRDSRKLSHRKAA